MLDEPQPRRVNSFEMIATRDEIPAKRWIDDEPEMYIGWMKMLGEGLEDLVAQSKSTGPLGNILALLGSSFLESRARLLVECFDAPARRTAASGSCTAASAPAARRATAPFDVSARLCPLDDDGECFLLGPPNTRMHPDCYPE